MIKRIFAGLAAFLAASILCASPAPAYINYDQPTGTSCCFASMAMVVTNITGLHRTPWDMLHQFSRYNVGGADHRLMKAIAKTKRYHLAAEYYGANSATSGMRSLGSVKAGLNRAKRSIPWGAEAVVLFHGIKESPHHSHFTAHGHCVVLYKYAHGHFRISDPNGKGRHGDSERKKGFSAKYLLRQGNATDVWIFFR